MYNTYVDSTRISFPRLRKESVIAKLYRSPPYLQARKKFNASFFNNREEYYRIKMIAKKQKRNNYYFITAFILFPTLRDSRSRENPFSMA